ncbi:tRNA glutamyl-Q(34) synthetase GluQRS [Glaciecola sp. SC05]|uniref:tRNA glutamyl-Q(34) synthetase GluQRS n=1 Tax=Glaciecola sp. SC05 TaxID=1987355 RepID=UPI00352885CF
MLREHPLSNNSKLLPQPYVGRFAPSPSGPLHFGSLVCALASFLHARQANGTWLVRIEDIDTPRVDTSTIPIILDSLLAHGMQWDAQPIYQSQRCEHYQHIINTLADKLEVYACKCSRKNIRARSEHYDQHCRDLNLPFKNYAVRWKNNIQRTRFCDLHYGMLDISNHVVKEDPVLKRADGVYNYLLAVVADDLEQQVTHVVRGADLIDTTPLQISFFEALHAISPAYMHIPLAVDMHGQKLSKQQCAPALDSHQAIHNLKNALVFLGLPAATHSKIDNVDTLLNWAIEHWQPQLMGLQTEILVSQTNGVYCTKN